MDFLINLISLISTCISGSITTKQDTSDKELRTKLKWSDPLSWEMKGGPHWGAHWEQDEDSHISDGVPRFNSDVFVPEDIAMLIDASPPVLHNLTVLGVLDITAAEFPIILEANYINVQKLIMTSGEHVIDTESFEVEESVRSREGLRRYSIKIYGRKTPKRNARSVLERVTYKGSPCVTVMTDSRLVEGIRHYQCQQDSLIKRKRVRHRQEMEMLSLEVLKRVKRV